MTIVLFDRPVITYKSKIFILISFFYIGALIYPASFAFSRVGSSQNLKVNTEHQSNQVRTGGKSPRAIVKSQSSNDLGAGNPSKAFNHWKSLTKNTDRINLNTQTSTSPNTSRTSEKIFTLKRRNVPSIKDLEQLTQPANKNILNKKRAPGVSDLKRLMEQPSSSIPTKKE